MHKKTLSLLKVFCSENNCKLQLGSFARKSLFRNAYCLLKPKNFDRLVVFSHGTGNDCLFPQLFLFKGLLKKNIAVIAFDLDGHGSTSSSLLNKESFFDQLIDWNQVIVRHFPKEIRLTFVGYSLGATLAFQTNPFVNPIERCFIVALPIKIHGGARGVFQEFSAITLREYRKFQKTIGIYEAVPALGPFKRGKFPIRLNESPKYKDSLEYVRIVDEILQQAQLTDDFYREIATVLIYGDMDQIAPISDAQVLQDKFPKAKLEILKNSTHFSILLNPELVALIASS